MRTLMFICCFTIINLGFSQEPSNGGKHLGAGAAIGAVGGYTAHKIFNGKRGWTWAGAVGSSVAAGLAKEAYDVSNGNEWQTDDVLYTAVGGLLSGFILDFIFQKKGDKKRSRKNCGCLLALSNSINTPILYDNGSRDITAHITAMSIAP